MFNVKNNIRRYCRCLSCSQTTRSKNQVCGLCQIYKCSKLMRKSRAKKGVRG